MTIKNKFLKSVPYFGADFLIPKLLISGRMASFCIANKKMLSIIFTEIRIMGQSIVSTGKKILMADCFTMYMDKEIILPGNSLKLLNKEIIPVGNPRGTVDKEIILPDYPTGAMDKKIIVIS